ncbi:Very-long-chain (3R)-3-hydroxyacyl-CoA dehydratase hpo-8 isoform 2 [Schistosoma japonicum]|uniref:Very-long-chain (3R)-3-hydroxyacyl-CoA dehydratase n=1 Tax=Schistosoma japonicum TaxID=6182 RepID=Q86FA4_SCHJA|nr:similar to NM_072339 T15B7 [Schistosoma japonicum]KAH8863690.1 Very-long-chain [Schistosoma japonicum]KAH8863692.1 Very-long-chain [Schistosoma japonicum]KAH8863693.1 Very-long-chain [Schistosoma japonicum]TNN05200.1 Very-long-chain (3R)-3-hydroxyacyl-CoA dehydratase hpo-8 isoform 2 [Schistosoma japonicum]
MSIRISYLATYNGVQLMGWAYILSMYIFESSIRKKWLESTAQVSILLRLFQSLAVIEIIHSAIGLVRSSVITTVMQISSRVLVVWGILYMVPEVGLHSWGVPLIAISWSVAEMIRYSYYMADICGAKLYLLTWLRYSAFMILYPTGIFGEVLLIVNAIKKLIETEKYSFNLPNALNCSFSYWFVLVVILVTYIPGSKVMYTHMMYQRRRVLQHHD